MGGGTKVDVEPSNTRVEPPAKAEEKEPWPPDSPPDLYTRMLLTGCLKCTLPIVFIFMSKPVSNAMAGASSPPHGCNSCLASP